MVQPDIRRFAYIRADREVSPSRALVRFLAKVNRIGRAEFEPLDSTFMTEFASLHQQLEPGYEPVSRGIDIPAVTIYPPGSLILTQFERLRLAKPDVGSAIGRLLAAMINNKEVDEHLDSMEAHLHEPNEALRFRATGLVKTTKTEYERLGEEYGLSATIGDPCAQTLMAQSKWINDYVMRTGPGSELGLSSSLFHPVIPVFRLPAGISLEHEQSFLEQAAAQLPEAGLQLALSNIDWVGKPRRAPQ